MRSGRGGTQSRARGSSNFAAYKTELEEEEEDYFSGKYS
jgi:hypothetical protein